VLRGVVSHHGSFAFFCRPLRPRFPPWSFFFAVPSRSSPSVSLQAITPVHLWGLRSRSGAEEYAPFSSTKIRHSRQDSHFYQESVCFWPKCGFSERNQRKDHTMGCAKHLITLSLCVLLSCLLTACEKAKCEMDRQSCLSDCPKTVLLKQACEQKCNISYDLCVEKSKN